MNGLVMVADDLAHGVWHFQHLAGEASRKIILKISVGMLVQVKRELTPYHRGVVGKRDGVQVTLRIIAPARQPESERRKARRAA